MTALQMVRAAGDVRAWRECQRSPPDAHEIKAFFLDRWPDIAAREVLSICRLALPPDPESVDL